MARITLFLAGILGAGLLLSAQIKSPGSFQNDVQPILAETCRNCHNDKLTSGNLDLTPFLDSASLTSNLTFELLPLELHAGRRTARSRRKEPAA